MIRPNTTPSNIVPFEYSAAAKLRWRALQLETDEQLRALIEELISTLEGQCDSCELGRIFKISNQPVP